MPIAVDLDIDIDDGEADDGRARGPRGDPPNRGYSRTAAPLCAVFKCQPADLLRWDAEDTAGG